MTSEERMYYLRNQYVDGLLSPDEEREFFDAVPNPDADEQVQYLNALKAQTTALPRERSPQRNLWNSIESEIAPASGPVGDSRTGIPGWAVTGLSWAGIAAAAVIAFILLRPGADEEKQGTGWSLASSEGTVYLGGQEAARHAPLSEGVLLRTGEGASATVSGVNIGTITLDANSELSVLRADSGQHRLKLNTGTMHAVVTTPPRFFFVETPSATAIDLGCAYTLETDKAGNGRLEVTAGWVAFEKSNHTAIVPRGFACRMYERSGPGTPYSIDAVDGFVTALNRYDEKQDLSAIYNAVEHARISDALSLWHLLWETTGEEKEYLCESLQLFEPMPEGVERSAILANDIKSFLRWGEELGIEPWMIGEEDIPTIVTLRQSKKM